MKQEISFAEFFEKVKTAFAKNDLALPEDIEMIELAHMEYLEEEAQPDEFIKKLVAEYKG